MVIASHQFIKKLFPKKIYSVNTMESSMLLDLIIIFLLFPTIF